MSTRTSIFYDHNQDTGVTIHIYEESASEIAHDIRLEVEFPHGVTNVPWPQEAFATELLQRAQSKLLIQGRQRL